jgi:hypothetical protein
MNPVKYVTALNDNKHSLFYLDYYKKFKRECTLNHKQIEQGLTAPALAIEDKSSEDLDSS